tara:strand:- start:460 stop:894 length:435 start_codon:yes stop_codon:yes gene_type:complete
MKRIKKYFKNILEILKFHDIQPLLLFWCFSDVLNNQVLWTNYNFWLELDQPNTYYLYMVYLVVSCGMLLFINKLVWLSRFITAYLLLTMFATVRYIVDLFTNSEADFDNQALRALIITIFYLVMWSWIWFKVKREILYKKISNG